MKKIIALLLVLATVISVAAFTAFAKTYNYITLSGGNYPESEHNYQDDMFCTWEYNYSSEAEGLFVTFSEESSLNDEVHYVQTEYGELPYYDYIYVSYLDGDGNWIYPTGNFRGKDLAGKTLYLPSTTFRVSLTSDAEGNDYGFAVDSVSTEPPEDETVIRYHYYTPDKVDDYSCHGDSEGVIAETDGIRNTGYVFAGWSTDAHGKPEHVAFDTLEAGRIHDLYAVWTKPLIAPENTFSFVNGDVGDVYPAEDNYYMTDGHYKMMIGNLFKNFGIGPIPGPVVALVLATFPQWEFRGSCYGIATSVFLHHHGAIDFLEGTDAENLSEIELNGEIISRLNYYQALSASSYLCENLAPQPHTPVYAEQLKNMFNTVAQGNPVLFSYYDYGMPYLLSTGHTVVFTGAFTDKRGNHFLIACDSNYRYSQGVCHYFRISPDFSEIYDCRKSPDVGGETQVGGFNWTADYEQFTSFGINGEGNPVVWYNVFFAHISYWLKTVFSAFFSI